MENYVDQPFPTKAGVYAVRAGPIIAQNVISFIKKEPLTNYEPQSGFLSLMMTGDSSSIGSKFGISFVGKWVWELKDMIDMSFMDLFNPNYLFENYKENGTLTPIENGHLNAENQKKNEIAKLKVADMEASEAAQILGCAIEETDYFETAGHSERWQFSTRELWVPRSWNLFR